jgi:hypothetical protein
MDHSLQRVGDMPIHRQLYTDLLQGNKPGKAQFFFLTEVLDRYVADAGYKVIRTNTSGRLSKVGGWSLDFGISGEGDQLIHTAAESFVHRVPSGEREHWLAFAVSLPVSANFIKGLIRPGCLDDGPIRKWNE